ncbi:hypothetical protein [Streptomyces sp. NPDC058335]|uniref:hypothetical protein n=1 Tax=Streptomyces sp. NPDC058335 TaxID=3346451 RepID=UPI00365AD811
MVTAELIVKLGEHVCCGLDRCHVAETDSHPVDTRPGNARLGGDATSHRSDASFHAGSDASAVTSGS